MWIRRHPIRTCVYAAFVAAAVVAVWRADAVAAWLVNGPASRALGRRLGASVSVGGIRLGRNLTEVADLHVVVDGDPKVRISAGHLRAEGLRSVAVTGAAFGETITAAEVRADIVGRSAQVSGIEFARTVLVSEAKAALEPLGGEVLGVSGPGVRIERASAGAVELGRDAVRIAAAGADAVRVEAARATEGRWNLEWVSALAPAVRQAAREGAALAEAYARLSPRLRDLLWWAITVGAAVVAAAKFALTCGRVPLRLLSAVAVLPAPFLMQDADIRVKLGVTAAVAVLLLILLYRRAPEWHQRAEPLAVDLAGPVLLILFLAAYSFAFPALPVVTPTVRIAQARVNGVLARIDAGRDRVTVDLPELSATGVTASAEGASVERVEFRGSAGSDFIRTRLGRYHYLPAEWRRPVRVEFSGRAGGGAPPPRYHAEVTLSGPGIGLSVGAEGDAERLRVTHLRSVEPSRLRIAEGRADVDLPPAMRAQAEVKGIAWGQFEAGAIDASVTQSAAEARVSDLKLSGSRLDTLLAKASYRRDKLAADLATRNLSYRPAGGTVIGDIPRIEVGFSGARRGDAIDGAIRLSSSRIGIDRPLCFSADLREGTLRVPDQTFVIKQTAAARAPESLVAGMELTAKVLSDGPAASARIRIPSLSPDVQPLGLELNGIGLSLDVAPRSRRIEFETGWSRIRYPDVFRPNRLETVGRLQADLHLTGELLSTSLLDGWRAPEFRPLPERFRIRGVWPELRLETDSEEPYSLEGLTASLNRISAPGSRIETVSFDFGLGSFAGRRLDLRSHVSLTDQLTRARATGAFRWAPAFDIGASPGGLDVAIPALRADLTEFPAGIRDLRVRADYTPGVITRASGSLTLDAGPAMDLDLAGAPVSRVQARLDAPARLGFESAQQGMSVDMSAPSFMLSAVTRSGNPIRIEGSVESSARLIRDAGPAPLFDTLLRMARMARPHWTRAAEYAQLGGPLDWRIAARNTAGLPFLRVTANRLVLRGAFDASPFRTGEVWADLHERGESLFVDASIPMTWEGRAPLTVPVELAITGPFPSTQAGRGLLWDPAAIEKIWATPSPRGTTRVVVGLGERIQFHAPASLRAFYGSVLGTAQAEMSWDGQTPVVTARVEGQFRNIQAGAAGLPLMGNRSPLVEDSLDGGFRAAVNGLAVPRSSLDRWRMDPASFDQFRHVDLSLEAFRTKGQPGPGVVQAGMDTRVHLLNAILQRIANELRFLTPPQMVTYRDLRASFEAVQGMIQTKDPLLELSGVRVFSTTPLEIDAQVRVRLGGRRGEPAPLSDLIRSALGGAQ